jgi:hypothetical protein
MIQGIIRKFLRGGSYTLTTIHYDMNAIKIRMYENNNSEQRYIFFYLYSPWRIIKNRTIINSSGLYPVEQHYASKAKHKKAFLKYCDTTKTLARKKIIKVSIAPRSNDLTIEWGDGTTLEKYCLDPKEYDYHIYDYLNNKSYDIRYDGISKRSMKSK